MTQMVEGESNAPRAGGGDKDEVRGQLQVGAGGFRSRGAIKRLHNKITGC